MVATFANEVVHYCG